MEVKCKQVPILTDLMSKFRYGEESLMWEEGIERMKAKPIAGEEEAVEWHRKYILTIQGTFPPVESAKPGRIIAEVLLWENVAVHLDY